MTCIYIQVKTNFDGKRINTDWTSCNPIDLGYDNTNSDLPFLVFYMQLGSLETEIKNNLEFKFTEKQQTISSYLERNQYLIISRGINQKNFPFLTNDEVESLEDLAFARHILEENFKEAKHQKNVYQLIIRFFHQN